MKTISLLIMLMVMTKGKEEVEKYRKDDDADYENPVE